MTVEVKYVVVRQGEEKMTFATKKEADAYDKMLDLADTLSEWLAHSALEMEESEREQLSFFLAEHKDPLAQLLRGGSLESVLATGEEAAEPARLKPKSRGKAADSDEQAA
ncbi:MAG: YebG family protein [Yersiniaceae bacterium]|uniref:Damage-inducible protein YebG n=1 Tax=Chimaeribacter coloradensis TaxID=2060068 RepID=A0A2N5ED76_9GAMM|nr:YebG family protein [Chimaeribacter coloradensis]MDU6411497.1 YebG family protein [Yersiniaceae bacterium]PLR40467.1 hypothetical protein CYR32_01615 [Chimaeribacter coloradensis]